MSSTSRTFLGGNEDDTVRCAGTIDGAGSSILQNVDALNVVGREVVNIGTGHTIYYIERCIGTCGTHTTNHDLVTLTGLSRVHHDVHT